MKELLKNLYKYLYHEDLVKIVKEECPVPEKTNGEKLLEHALKFYETDPTPLDKQPDEYACVESLTTIMAKIIPMPIMTYTPTLLTYIQKDKRFRAINEFKEGAIIISPTGSGSGRLVGHTGICGKDGKILSNSSATGLWSDKFNHTSWVERYSRQGGLFLYIFEVV